MKGWKSIVATGLLYVAVLAVMACEPVKKDTSPEPQFTVPMVGAIIGDGIYELGTELPLGKWESVKVPSDIEGCAWFVASSETDSPGISLPTYTNDHTHRKVTLVFDKTYQGRGFITQRCGDWMYLGDAR